MSKCSTKEIESVPVTEWQKLTCEKYILERTGRSLWLENRMGREEIESIV